MEGAKSVGICFDDGERTYIVSLDKNQEFDYEYDKDRLNSLCENRRSFLVYLEILLPS